MEKKHMTILEAFAELDKLNEADDFDDELRSGHLKDHTGTVDTSSRVASGYGDNVDDQLRSGNIVDHSGDGDDTRKVATGYGDKFDDEEREGSDGPYGFTGKMEWQLANPRWYDGQGLVKKSAAARDNMNLQGLADVINGCLKAKESIIFWYNGTNFGFEPNALMRGLIDYKKANSDFDPEDKHSVHGIFEVLTDMPVKDANLIKFKNTIGQSLKGQNLLDEFVKTFNLKMPADFKITKY